VIERIDCPVQSASDRILQLMNRGYQIKDWKKIIREISLKYPNVKIGTHIMVGFPSESDYDFKKSLKLLSLSFNILYCYLFKFSGGSNAIASNFPCQISEEVKNIRYNKVQRRYLISIILNVLLNNRIYDIKSRIFSLNKK
jgi:tRNA A37 methylthiotransferase MiaB